MSRNGTAFVNLIVSQINLPTCFLKIGSFSAGIFHFYSCLLEKENFMNPVKFSDEQIAFVLKQAAQASLPSLQIGIWLTAEPLLPGWAHLWKLVSFFADFIDVTAVTRSWKGDVYIAFFQRWSDHACDITSTICNHMAGKNSLGAEMFSCCHSPWKSACSVQNLGMKVRVQ